MLKENASVLCILGALTIGSILACGGTTGGTPCTTDEDCQDNFICDSELNECVETCVSDDECDLADECKIPPGSSGSQKICLPRESTSNNMNNPMMCTTNEDCGDVEQFFCNDQQKCEAFMTPDKQYYIIRVEDISVGDDACEKFADPGSDILYARVTDSGGDVLGYGQQVALEFGDESSTRGNNYQDFSHLNGSEPPDLDGTLECPNGEFKNASLVALGCGGRVNFEFISSSTGMPIKLTADMKVEVAEYGPNCGGSDADRYEVALCTDTADAKNGSFASCTQVLSGSNQGFTSVDIRLP